MTGNPSFQTSALRVAGLVPDPSLSASANKLATYETDSYFRETWEDLAGSVGEPSSWARDAALGVLKPDAVAGRRLHLAMEWLKGHGFSVVDARIVRFDRLLIRELWRYQFNVATRRRIEVVDRLLTMCGSLLLIMVDENPTEEESASVRLCALKGPSNPKKRQVGQFRADLASPNVLLNFLHTADEPADVVREIGVFLDTTARREVIAAVLHRVPTATDALIGVLEAETPPHDLDFTASLHRMRVAVAGHSAEAVALCDRIADGTSDNWPALLAAVGRCAADVALWDQLVIATQLTESNLTGVQPLLDEPDASSSRLRQMAP